MTDHPNACNNLTCFECEVYIITGNGNYVNHLKLALRKFVKSQQVNLFCGGFYPFQTTAVHIARAGACTPNAHCQGFQISSLRSLASSSWDFFPSYYYITAVCSLA